MPHTNPTHEVLNKLSIDMASPVTKSRRIFFLLVSFQYCVQSFKQATQLDVNISSSTAELLHVPNTLCFACFHAKIKLIVGRIVGDSGQGVERIGKYWSRVGSFSYEKELISTYSMNAIW